MKILALDSTARAASAAVMVNGDVVACFTADVGQTHSEVLLPMAEAACRAASLTVSEADCYAVTVGPGSFTGVRIGVATVKGLAFRFPEDNVKNCVAVSTLEALAENLYGLDGILCAVMDARRKEVYNALFRMENGTLTRLTPDRAISLAALAEELRTLYKNEPIRLSGDGYDVAHAALTEAGVACPETPYLLRLQNASSVARCANRAVLLGNTVTEASLSPVYLRMPQAERERLEREKAEKKETQATAN